MSHDVLIVGSGPAGVSAAFALLGRGLRVLMVDGGRTPRQSPPEGDYLQLRHHDTDQWKWMIGRDFHALRQARAVSPKLRVPGFDYVFEDFETSNPMAATGFIALGSLAAGGLSNAWGCGVAKWSEAELSSFPFRSTDLDASYAVVARRMGLSGANADDLQAYFGVDAWSGPPVPLDTLQQSLRNRYDLAREKLVHRGFRLGRSRVAVLTEAREGRLPCNLQGNCLWGCSRGALYSAAHDIAILKQNPRFDYLPGFVVSGVTGGTVPAVQGKGPAGAAVHRARRVLLAAGTLATSRLVLQALPGITELPLHSCPTAAFLLWVPSQFGRGPSPAFGLGQLSFALGLPQNLRAFGSLFNPQGIPLAEFVRHAPLGKPAAVDVLGTLLRSSAVGNVFLPSSMPSARLSRRTDGSMQIDGMKAADHEKSMALVRHHLGTSFRKLGAHIIPGSFTAGAPGSDIHYGCSMPMRSSPALGETSVYGEVEGLPHVHAIDGSCLSALSEKSHTMTIMANADRIGRHLTEKLA